ncbi:MAG TPA: class I SAM-dependent methyltransferase [Stellaceae bacterium]|nr:class I SAM-dependent methyltransferase [Stellaceae bacterium]
MSEPDWQQANRTHWDERTSLHLGPRGYDLSELRAGRDRLNAIEEDELGDLSGKRILHLQCHFGRDSLILLQRGAASVIGLDFSAAAIAAARDLARELGLADRASFVEADLYRALDVLPEPGSFDMVFVTWGALCWLPDIKGWADIVAAMLRRGGQLYLAETHPAAFVFDEIVDAAPIFDTPYFGGQPIKCHAVEDYVGGEAHFEHAEYYLWLHPLAEIVTSLLDAGMRLDWLHEHDAISWRMFRILVEDERGLYRWPDKPWLPLAFSLAATRL